MTRRSFTRRSVPPLALLALSLTAAVAWSPLSVRLGPPWISIEVPPNPFDRASRGAFLLVHAFHHGTPAAFPVTGTAEGIMNGERRSVKLDFQQTSRPAVYALRKQWPSEGAWVLVISVTQEGNDVASALVELGASGEVASVKVPTTRQDGWDIPRRISAQEVAAALSARRVATAGRQ